MLEINLPGFFFFPKNVEWVTTEEKETICSCLIGIIREDHISGTSKEECGMKWAQDGVLKESVPYMPEQRKAFQERHSGNRTLESYSLGAELGVTLTHKGYSYCITIYISHSIHPDPGSLPHQL